VHDNGGHTVTVGFSGSTWRERRERERERERERITYENNKKYKRSSVSKYSNFLYIFSHSLHLSCIILSVLEKIRPQVLKCSRIEDEKVRINLTLM